MYKINDECKACPHVQKCPVAAFPAQLLIKVCPEFEELRQVSIEVETTVSLTMKKELRQFLNLHKQ